MPKERKFVVNQAGDVELRLDDRHTLIVHRSDEGIVLDVWRQGARESVWSTYFFDDDMMEKPSG